MKRYITLDPINYPRLSLIAPAIALLGLTRRSTADPSVRLNTAAGIPKTEDRPVEQALARGKKRILVQFPCEIYRPSEV